MINVVRAELLKLRRRPGIRVLVGLWPFLGIVFGYLIPYLIRNLDEIQATGDPTAYLLPDQFVANAISGFPQFGLALVVILGGLAVGSEYGWGTIGATLIQRPTRTTLHLGRLLALSLIAAVMTLLALVVAALSSLLVAALLSEAVTWPPLGDIGLGLAAGWLILTVGVVLGAFLALILRSTALAVGLGLVYVFILEGLFGGFARAADWVASIARYLPGVNATGVVATLQDANVSFGPQVDPLVTGTHATVVLAVYLLALSLIGLVVFLRRDVAG